MSVKIVMAQRADKIQIYAPAVSWGSIVMITNGKLKRNDAVNEDVFKTMSFLTHYAVICVRKQNG